MSRKPEEYASLLLDWNRKTNLTGASNMAEINALIKDSEQLLTVDWSTIRRVVDIGSGAGIPGIPLAIELPQVGFALVEASGRKAAFITHAAGVLGLTNVQVISERAEVLGRHPEYREGFDRAISRAAAPPPVLLELALPLVKKGGDLLAQVGQIELGSLAGPARLLGGEEPTYIAFDDRHGLLRVRKVTNTPPEYPRRPGVPNRRPLT